jgi:hygromycin-B 7''-O-kinase
MTSPSKLPLNIPNIADEAEYLRFFNRPEDWLPIMQAIAQRHGHPPNDVIPLNGGSNLVCSLGQHLVIKALAPIFAAEFDIETQALARARQAIPHLVPEVVLKGDFEGWPYLFIQRQPGLRLTEVWPSLEWAVRASLLAQLGDATANLHSVSTVGLDALTLDWPAFVRGRIAGCVERQRRLGLTEELVAQIPGFLESIGPRLDADCHRVLLHADLTGGNLLVSEQQGAWRLSGIIDFADSFVGPSAYEFASPIAFLVNGQPGLLRPMLTAYGYADNALDEARQAQLFAFVLLHRFANLQKYIAMVQDRHVPDTLEQVAKWLVPY